MKTLTRRLARLEARLPPPPSPELLRQLELCAPLFDRWDRLGAAAFALMTPDEQIRVHQGVKELHEGPLNNYGDWVASLCLGLSRLPELAPEVMKDLLVIRVFNEVAGSFVCVDCGLEYPFRQWPEDPDSQLWLEPPRGHSDAVPPEFYPACPHCGGTNKEIAGSDRVAQQAYPWKSMDGYVTPAPAWLRGQI
jgi:hypothetical protein